MSEFDSPRYSYLRYSYEVEQTKPMTDFLDSIADIINEQIPANNFRASNGATRLSELGEAAPAQDRVLIPVKFRPYPINTLRFTLFEQRLLRSQANNRKLERLSRKLNSHKELFERLAKIATAANLEEGMGPEVIVHAVEETTRSADAHLGKEFGVVASTLSTGAAMMLEQAGVVYEVAKGLGIGSEVIDTEPPENVAIPFVRLPRDTDEAVIKGFVAAANAALPADGLDVPFSPDLSISPMIRHSMR